MKGNFFIFTFVILILVSCNNASNIKTDETENLNLEPANVLKSNFANVIVEARKGKDLYFKTAEILELDKLNDFKGLQYFGPDSNFVFNAEIEFLKPEKVLFKTATEREPLYYTFCKLIFIHNQVKHELIAYSDKLENVTDLFIPFKDSTNYTLTYGGGRYLELKYRNEKSNFIIDFNYAFNPYCHYNHSFSCPLVPENNILQTHIFAGERKLYE